jgi:hypothetical protein
VTNLDTAPAAEIFPHVRVIMGMVLSLGLARLLTGSARFIQHPGKFAIYPVHLGWAASILLLLVHFWWWEYRLYLIPQWTVTLYLFLITYTILLFALCALLFPDNIEEYASYEDYFISRRRWFFGILAFTFLFDYLDTLIKGREHAELFGIEYELRLPAYIILCAIAALTSNRLFHAAFITLSLIYQLSWILRLFDTLD